MENIVRTLLADSTIVIVAHDVNLSIFKPPWLVKCGFLREDELSDDVIMSPVMMRLATRKFQFTVLPDRIQMGFPGPVAGEKSEVDRVLGGVVRKLPHTPYSACGVNFNYLAAVDSNAYRDWCARAFASEAAKRAVSPDAEDARFGSYCSLNVLGSRLKLDIKPTRTSPQIVSISSDWVPDLEVMSLNFNYHTELAEFDAPEQSVLGVLAKWDDFLAHSQAIVTRLPE